jgi:hypothetical protein
MDHKKDDVATDIANGTVTSSSGNVKPKITTQGWQLLMLWKDKLTSYFKGGILTPFMLLLILYGPMRSTHSLSHGIASASFS